jgi:formylglycine-generating enzyme required for sulfatase activity
VPRSQTTVPQGEDADGDDWGRCCDCDDGDDQVHPGRQEQVDGKDNDCNGLVDEPGGFMVPVPLIENLWIDVYEISVYETADCAGTRYGAGVDDYPAGWPADASQPAVTLYACSLPGVLPSGHLSWNRARRACEAQGKRLCRREEWEHACGGGAAHRSYPYGSNFVPSVCNLGYGGGGQLAETGAYSGCVSLSGTFDMSGNLNEWVRDWDGTTPGSALTGGASYACLICEDGTNCHVCDTLDVEDVERLEWSADCQPRDEPYESFPRDRAAPDLGARCCYESQP